MFVSACMIAKNEESNIEKCILSYKPFVDEIIVVDTGSDDKTAEIARQLDARVYFYEWNSDFAAAKNYALTHARGDWIIFLDADEYFCEESSKRLRKVLKKHLHNKKIDCITCKILNIDADKNNKLIEESVNIRIFRKKEGLCYVGNIHEELRINDKTIPNIFYEKELLIYHTGYSNSINEEKTKRNLEILLKNRKNCKDFCKNEFYLAKTYENLGQFDKVLDHIVYVLEDGRVFVGNPVKPFEIFFRAMIETNNYSVDYDKWQQIGEKKHPYMPLFSCVKGYKYFYNLEYTKALESFNKGIELNSSYSVDCEINFMRKNIDSIYYFIASIYEKKNNIKKAIENYIDSLKHNKFNVYSLIRLLILTKDKEDIIGLLNGIYNINQKEELQFLLKQLSNLKIAKVFLHYYNIWKNSYGEGLVYGLIALLCAGNYQKAFDILINATVKAKEKGEDITYFEPLLVVCSVFAPDNIERTMNAISPPYQKIVKLLCGQISECLTDTEFTEYFNILKEIISLTNQSIARLFLSANKCFSVGNMIKISSLLEEWCAYPLAMEVLSAIEAKGVQDLSVINMQMGILSYKLSDFEKSKQYFDNAKELGYKNQDIFEYLLWLKNC